MGLFQKKNTELDALLTELQMNLENNYKDLAIQARRDAESCYARLVSEGKLSQKMQARYRACLDSYAERMKHYDHTDISKFLKERL